MTTNTVSIESSLLLLLALQISKLVLKYEMELDDKVMSKEEALKALKRIFGKQVTMGDLRGEHNTGENLHGQFLALGFDIPLVYTNLISRFLKEWSPSSPQCDQPHTICSLYGVDFSGKALKWLERGNECPFCPNGTIQVGEGQQTHHWNWVLGTLVPVSETVHRMVGFTWALEEKVIETWFDPTLFATLKANKVSAGRFLAYLMNSDHGLPVQKDPHSVQASVGKGGALAGFAERALYAHVVKAGEMGMEGKTVRTARKTDAASPKKRLIVLSYHPKDVGLAETIKTHLKPLCRSTGVELWSRADVRPGQSAEQLMGEQLDVALIVIPLLSVHYLAAMDDETAVERETVEEKLHAGGGTRIVPVIAGAVHSVGAFTGIQGFPFDSFRSQGGREGFRPITKGDLDQNCSEVARGIRDLLARL